MRQIFEGPPGYGPAGLLSCPGGAYTGPHCSVVSRLRRVVSMAAYGGRGLVCGHSSVCRVTSLCQQARRRSGRWRPLGLSALVPCPSSSARVGGCVYATDSGGCRPPSPQNAPGCPWAGRRLAGGAPPAEGMSELTLPHSCGKFPARCRPAGCSRVYGFCLLAAHDHLVRLWGLCVPPFVSSLMASGRVGW